MKRKVEKEKKYNYKFILGIIVGGVVFGLLGVYAATQIASSNVTYTNNNQSTVSGALDDLFKKTLYLGKIKVGDYVKMTPTLTSYTISTTDTGYSSTQTINPSELNIWRIISINSDGTADAVSEYVSSTNVAFGTNQSNTTTLTASNSNVIAYANLVGTLNKIASSYNNSKYVARTRHMGYGGGTQYITDTSKLIQTTAPWTASTSYSTTPADEVLGAGDMGSSHDYNLVKNVLGTGVANKIGTTTRTAYWLASRSYISLTNWHICGDLVGGDGKLDKYYLYRREDSNWIFTSKTYAIRPIITLKSGLTTNGGDGKSEATAWTFE